MNAGLGDVAIPGLLACLALRYDASRVVDLRARGVAVASALQDALGSMDVRALRFGGRLGRLRGLVHACLGLQGGQCVTPFPASSFSPSSQAEERHPQRHGRGCGERGRERVRPGRRAGELALHSLNERRPRCLASGALSPRCCCAPILTVSPLSPARQRAPQEEEQQARTQGASASGSSETVYRASDAVLYQRTYFTPVMWAYLLGLSAAFGVNAVTHMGQPALLYLCPATLGAVLLTAAQRRELGRIWAFTDTTAVNVSQQAKDRAAAKQQRQEAEEDAR